MNIITTLGPHKIICEIFPPVKDIKQFDKNYSMVSFNIQSLFTTLHVVDFVGIVKKKLMDSNIIIIIHHSNK